MELTASLTVAAASLTAVTACRAIRRGVEAERRRVEAARRGRFRADALRRAEVAAERTRRRAPEAFADTFRRALVRPFLRVLLVRDAGDLLLEGITSISFCT